LALKIANGYENVKSRHLFRDFVDATAHVNITERHITVKSLSDNPLAPVYRVGSKIGLKKSKNNNNLLKKLQINVI